MKQPHPVSIRQSFPCLVPSATLALGLLVSAPASADLGREGDLALGVERVFGLTKQTVDQDGEETGRTDFSLFFPAVGSTYARPRVALDFFVMDYVSVGGGVAFYTWSPSEGDASGSGWLFAPRAGYLAGITDEVSLWPRVGFTLVSEHTSGGNDNEQTRSAYAVTLELPVLVMLADNIAIDIGLNLDVGIGGELEQETGNTTVAVDRTTTELGVHAGLTTFF